MGDPPLTSEMVIDNLRESLIQRALGRLSPSEMISRVEWAMEQAETELAEILAQTDVTDAEQWSRYEQPIARVQIARACESVEASFALGGAGRCRNYRWWARSPQARSRLRCSRGLATPC